MGIISLVYRAANSQQPVLGCPPQASPILVHERHSELPPIVEHTNPGSAFVHQISDTRLDTTETGGEACREKEHAGHGRGMYGMPAPKERSAAEKGGML